jgi:hypothetical protein
MMIRHTRQPDNIMQLYCITWSISHSDLTHVPQQATQQTAAHVAAALGFDAILGELLDRRATTFIVDKVSGM